jgi:hypothetical protein
MRAGLRSRAFFLIDGDERLARRIAALLYSWGNFGQTIGGAVGLNA